MGLLDRYKSWVRNNAAQIGFIDQALTSLTWLMPDRFSGTEFAAEAIDASIALLRLYNESILQPVSPAVAGRKQIPWPFWLAVIREVCMSVLPSSCGSIRSGSYCVIPSHCPSKAPLSRNCSSF
jgi:hypothetical protein